MKKFFYLMAFAAVILSGCSESFKKGDKGIEYKIISEGKGKVISYNNFMQVHLRQSYKDSKQDTVLSDTRKENIPQIFRLDSTNFPPEFFKILSLIRTGDSVVIRVKSDSIIKNSPPGGAPAFMQNGQYFYTTLKVLNIFETPRQADSANKVAFEAKMKQDSLNDIGQLAKDDKTLSDYLTKNNIKTTKAPLGTYVEIIQQGTGALIDTGKFVKVNYTGKTLEGKPFDSNIDPQFNHMEPIVVNMKGGVVKGWLDGFSLLSKGAKAKFYIPSPLGYGSRGSGEVIKPNEILVFDIDVLDVITQEQAKAEEEKKRKQMQEMQKRYMDSMQKAQADTMGKRNK